MEKQMKEASHYQQLTFDALHALMENAAKKGHSKLIISEYMMGDSMKKVLEDKGFTVFVSITGSSCKTIAW
jgi:hypothetical protein